MVLPIRSRRVLPLANPRMEDRRIFGKVGERWFFRDAFKYQHPKRVCVRMRRCGDGIAVVELGR